jgi:hypothetical protein
VLTIGCSKSSEQPQGGGQAAATGQVPGGKPAYEVSYTGYTSRVYEHPQEACVSATKVALQHLSLRVDEESPGLFKKSFVASGADGTTVAVQVVELGRTASRVSIKVGYLLGDRDAAQRIHSEIENELGRQGGGAVATGTADWSAPPQAAAQVTTTSRPNVTFWTSPPTTVPAPPAATATTLPAAPARTLPPPPPPPPPPPAAIPPPAPVPPAASAPRPSPPPAGAAPAAGWD